VRWFWDPTLSSGRARRGFGSGENDLDASFQERIDGVYTWQANKADERKKKTIIHRGCRRTEDGKGEIEARL